MAKPRRGDRHSSRIEARSGCIWELVAEQGDMTLVEIQAQLVERDVSVSIGKLHRFFVRNAITRKKKTVHAIEQDCPDALRQRRHWFAG